MSNSAAHDDRTSEGPAVLITGTSTGIGAACALDLDRLGHRVFAGVRREEDGRQLAQQASKRLTPVILDVTAPAAIRSAVEFIEHATEKTGLHGLVNNAGISIPGLLELLSTATVRRQFEVNVIGTLAVTRAMLPLLRRGATDRTSRVVNMGSIAGKLAPPYLGCYAGSKHALEALTDAMRMEFCRFRIDATIVEPDSVVTPIWDKLQTLADEHHPDIPAEVAELYEEDVLAMRRASFLMGKTGMSVDRVVRAVRHAICAKRPKTRYPVGFRTRLAFWAVKNVPDRWRDWFVLRAMKKRR